MEIVAYLIIYFSGMFLGAVLNSAYREHKTDKEFLQNYPYDNVAGMDYTPIGFGFNQTIYVSPENGQNVVILANRIKPTNKDKK